MNMPKMKELEISQFCYAAPSSDDEDDESSDIASGSSPYFCKVWQVCHVEIIVKFGLHGDNFGTQSDSQ